MQLMAQKTVNDQIVAVKQLNKELEQIIEDPKMKDKKETLKKTVNTINMNLSVSERAVSDPLKAVREAPSKEPSKTMIRTGRCQTD